jgi:DNA-binding LacI/PurR family transcriptional regulator
MTRRATIVDVAQAARVSLSTASVALNGRPGVSDVTRERIRRIADDLNYAPSLRAKSLPSKRAFTIGFVVQRVPEVMSADPFFGAFIAGVQVAITKRNYAMILQVSPSLDETEQLYRTLAASRRVDGVLLDQLRIDDTRISLVQELRLPAVAIGPESVTAPLPLASQSAAAGITELVEHLVTLGHRDIAHVCGQLDYVHSRERRDTWEAAVRAAGLAPGAQVQGDFTVASGRHAADELMRLDRLPTAVVCVNDLCAIGLMLGLQSHGVDIPGELSVVGFDGIDLATYVHPTLTTVAATPTHVGEVAASMLLDAIDEPDAPPARVRIELGPMIMGASTAPPRPGR